MSQSKAARTATKPAAGKAAVKTAGKTKAKAKPDSAAADELSTVRVIPAAKVHESEIPMSALSTEVKRLAAAIETELKKGDGREALHPDALQAMMAALCRVYSVHVEVGENYGAFDERNPVTPTDVMVTASGLLKAANLAVFELGMWQSWTGR